MLSIEKFINTYFKKHDEYHDKYNLLFSFSIEDKNEIIQHFEKFGPNGNKFVYDKNTIAYIYNIYKSKNKSVSSNDVLIDFS